MIQPEGHEVARGRLVVHEVLPPAGRHEFGQDDGDDIAIAAAFQVLDVLEQGPDDRPVWRFEDHEGNAAAVLAPALAESSRRD